MHPIHSTIKERGGGERKIKSKKTLPLILHQLFSFGNFCIFERKKKIELKHSVYIFGVVEILY